MKKKALLFSRDPGGANTVIPLVNPLIERGYNVLLYGKDFALDKYSQAGLKAADIMTEISVVDEKSVSQFVQHVSPDIVVTGTSADDYTEKLIWSCCCSLEIPSMAILDQWYNYGLRFSAYGVDEVEKYELERDHPFLPFRIIAMDEFARTEMIAEGLPEERIVVCGQPYFEKVFSASKGQGAIEKFNSAHNLSMNEFVVAFASEPITTTYGDGAISHFGYTECSILNSLVSVLEKICAVADVPLLLAIRPHPKEDGEKLKKIVKQSRHVRWCIDRASAPWALMARANLVCGMSSMFLIEAALMGRPVQSIQIGLSCEDPFVLSRRGIMKPILTKNELCEFLQNCIVNNECEPLNVEVINNPVERIIAEMEKSMCLN